MKRWGSWARRPRSATSASEATGGSSLGWTAHANQQGKNGSSERSRRVISDGGAVSKLDDAIPPNSTDDLMVRLESQRKELFRRWESINDPEQLKAELGKLSEWKDQLLGQTPSGSPPASVILRAHYDVPEKMASDVRKRLKKAIAGLQATIAAHTSALWEIDYAERGCRKQVLKELYELRRCAQEHLIPIFRKHAWLQITELEAKNVLHREIVIALKERKAEISSQLDAGHALDSEDERRLLTDPREIVKTSSKLMREQRRVQIMEIKLRKAAMNYGVLREQAIPRDQIRKVHTLIIRTEAVYEVGELPSWCFFEDDRERQSIFNRLIADERTNEGRLLHEFEKRLPDMLKDFESAQSVNEFVDKFFELVMHNYRIPNVHALKVRLFLTRLVFTRCVNGAFFTKARRDELWEKDLKFIKQAEWLCSLDAKLLGVDACLLVGEDGMEPFKDAIDELGNISFYTVPTDMLFCLARASRSIFSYVKRVAPHMSELGADAFFPLFFYVCSRAHFWDINICTEYMNTFASNTERITEMGYYLTCLEGAVAYISNITAEEVRLDNLRESESQQSLAPNQPLVNKSSENVADSEKIFSKNRVSVVVGLSSQMLARAAGSPALESVSGGVSAIDAIDLLTPVDNDKIIEMSEGGTEIGVSSQPRTVSELVTSTWAEIERNAVSSYLVNVEISQLTQTCAKQELEKIVGDSEHTENDAITPKHLGPLLEKKGSWMSTASAAIRKRTISGDTFQNLVDDEVDDDEIVSADGSDC